MTRLIRALRSILTAYRSSKLVMQCELHRLQEVNEELVASANHDFCNACIDELRALNQALHVDRATRDTPVMLFVEMIRDALGKRNRPLVDVRTTIRELVIEFDYLRSENISLEEKIEEMTP